MLIYSDHHHSSIKKYTYNYNDSLNPPALDFNFERAVGGSILTVSKKLSLKNLNVIIRAIN